MYLKKIIVYTICIFFIALLQSTIINSISIFNVKPNIILIFVILISLIGTTTETIIIGFFSGMVIDAVSGRIPGVYTLLYMYLALLFSILNRKLYYKNLTIAVLLVAISTVLYEILFYTINLLTIGISNFNILVLIKLIGIEVIYNALITCIMYFVTIKIYRIFNKNDKSLNVRGY